MQSRTGRVNQRKCAHETFRNVVQNLAIETSPDLPFAAM